jgi:MarR family 2-MHQ and catechol resistance regulon transcriptional repressor
MGTHYSGDDTERLALDSFIKLIRAARTVSAGANAHLGDWELTDSQFGVLEVVYHLGPMCQKKIGQKLLKSGGNISVVIDNLEDRGLVERRRRESDRRFVSVHLTDEGESLVERVLPKHVDRIREMFSALDVEEQQTLGELCRKLGRSQSRMDDHSDGQDAQEGVEEPVA